MYNFVSGCLLVQCKQMEFEDNRPATTEEIALANAPRLTLKPTHSDVAPEPLNTTLPRQDEPNFAFDAESTQQVITAEPQAEPRAQTHKTALIVSVGCALLFACALTGMLVLR